MDDALLDMKNQGEKEREFQMAKVIDIGDFLKQSNSDFKDAPRDIEFLNEYWLVGLKELKNFVSFSSCCICDEEFEPENEIFLEKSLSLDEQEYLYAPFHRACLVDYLKTKRGSRS